MKKDYSTVKKGKKGEPTKFEKFVDDAEIFIDKTIPYSLIILLYLLIVIFFFPEFEKQYYTIHLLLEAFVIGTFGADLVFKYLKLRNFPLFLKKYWLDVIIVFPFFLFFKLLEPVFSLFRLAGTFEGGSVLFHAGIEMQKELRLIGQVEGTAPKLMRMLRIMKLAPYLKRHHLNVFN